MQAVMYSGNKPYTVKADDVIVVERMKKASAGDKVRFDDVRLVTGDAGTTVGTPRVDGAAVVGTILSETKGPKLRIMKFRRRKDSQTAAGHRQKYDKVKITGIEGV